MRLSHHLVLFTAVLALARAATKDPSDTCIDVEVGDKKQHSTDLRYALNEAEQAVERLQEAVHKYKALLSAEDVDAPDMLGRSPARLDQGASSALQPFQRSHQRLVAHGLLKWADSFHLQAAVRTDEPVSAMLPILAPHSAQVHLFVVGDAGGTIYIFDAQGILKHELRSGPSSKVQAMTHQQLNASSLALVAGYHNGDVVVYTVILQPRRYGASQEGLQVKHVQATAHIDTWRPTGDSAPVEHLVALKQGPGSMPIIAAASANNLALWTLNGSFVSWASLPGRIVLVHTSPPYLVLVHEQGVSKLLLSSLSGPARLHKAATDTSTSQESSPASQLSKGLSEFACEGWNGSRVTAAAFEASGRGHHKTVLRVHALTQGGEMLSISLGPSLRGPCKVRHRVQLMAGAEQLDTGMAALPGYTLLAAGPAIAALNESSAFGNLGSPPRMVLLDGVSALAAACNQQVEDSPVPLLLGTTAASAVPLRVAPRVAALFSSTLPGRGAVQRPYWEPFMRPLLMILAIGVAYWQFGRGRSGSGSAGSQLSAQLPEELRAALGPEGLRAAQGRDRGPASDDFFDRQLQLGSAARRAYRQGGAQGDATLERIASGQVARTARPQRRSGAEQSSTRHRGPAVNPMPAEGIFADDNDM